MQGVSAKERGIESRMPTRRVWHLLFSAIFVFVMCENLLCKATSEALPAYLVVIPGAGNVKHQKSHGKDQLSYHIEAQYPAASLLKMIRGRLQRIGWKPLAQDFLNPGIPSSIVRGWGYHEDLATQPKTSVRVWQTDWENRAHDVVTYRLEYRCKDNLCSSTKNLTDLEVIAIYIPARLTKPMN